MHSKSFLRVFRMFMVVAASTFLVAACGQGSGPAKIPGNPAPPPPPPPPSNCADAIDFEDACGPFAFNDFGGGASAVIDNPDVSGINTTAKVAQLQKFDAEVFGGSTLALAAPVDFSGGEFFTVKVRASRAVPLLFKFEGLNQERTENHSGSGSWEQLCFDFSGSTAGAPATDITFIFDLGVLGDATNNPADWTFQVDGIEQATSCAGGGGPGTLVFADEFDTGSTPDPTFWNLETGYGPNNDGWGNNEWQNYTNLPENVRVENGNLVISALCPSGTCGVRDGTVTSARINTKDKFEFRYGRVEARIQMPDGPAIWPAFWALGANLDDVGWPNAGEIDFTEVFNTNSDVNTTHFSMFWCDESLTAPNPCSDVAGGRASSTDTFRLNESLGNDFHVYSAEWNENQITGMIDGITYFVRDIDPGTMEEFQRNFFLLFNVAMGGAAGSANQPPDGSEVFPQTMLVDYVRVYDAEVGAGSGEDTVIDFERDPVSYDFGMDGGFGGGASSVIANPEQNGINTSAQVGQMLKFAGEVFGGSTLALPSPLQITEAGNFTMKVWSPRAVNVLLKVEGPVESEVEIAHGGSGWEELTFDFSSFTGQVNGITLIFDLGTVGNADNDPDNWTFYFDDITIPTGTGGGGSVDPITLPVTFEDVNVDYELTDFGGAATTMPFVDPTDVANTVASTNKPPGAETFAGTTLANSSGFGAIPFTASETTMTVRVYSPDAGIPVRLKAEDRTDNTISVETEAVTTTANAWETLTFNFANEVAGTAALNLANTYDKASIFFNFGTDGNTAGDKTYLWDDVAFGGGGGGGGQITLPVSFEDGLLDYELTDFGGVVTTMPFTDPTDAGNTVASSNKAPGAELWGGTTVANDSGFGAIPFSATDTSMTVRVYSPDAGIPVRLKVEDRTDPTISVETEAVTTTANAWETLTFNFANPVAGTAALNLANTYDKASIFFNFGTDGNTAGDKTYLWDDLAFLTGGGGGSSSVDFEGGSYTFNDFGGAVAAVVANPDASGINTSSQVAQMQKFAGETFAGSTLDLGGPVAFASGDSYTMKVRAQRSVVVTLKLEPLNEERTATHSGSGTWEELCFDFTGVSGNVTGLTVIFDNGTAGDAANDPDNWTFQFDDIAQTSSACPTGGGQITLPVTFEDGSLDYELTDFGGVVTTMPFTDPTDAGNTVASSNKAPGAELWGGTTIADMSGFGAIPFTATETSMTVRVYSPDAGIPVRLKAEDRTDPTISVETEAVTTTANAWETLTFDFANEVAGTAALNLANTYDKASIFFNFGTDGNTAGDKTYLWDDVAFGGGGGGGGQITLPVSFEDGSLDYELTDFGGVVTTMPFTDPTDAGNTVASSNKAPGAELWGGTTIADMSGFGAIPFTASATTMTVRVYSPDAGIPVRLKAEDRTDPTISVETEALTTTANAWETLTFDFANPVAGTAALNLANTYDKASIFFNFGTDGNTAGDKTYLWDDVAFGGGGGGNAVTLPVSFEDSGLDYELTDFGGVVTTMPFTDPTDAGNTVASSNKAPGAELWGGTTVANDSGFGAIPFSATDTSMTVRVYSPDAGIPVRLKVEDRTDPTISVETEAVTTTANAWETLTFDFANPVAGTAALNLANTYDKASIFFNFGTDGNTAGDKTYLWDDVAFGGGGGGNAVTLPVTFEDGSLDYELTDFGGVVTTMPFTDPTDAGNTVASSNKAPGAELWGGTTVANDSGFGAIPFSATDTSMTVRVYSPDAGIPVRLKVEDRTDPTISVETEAVTTTANAWETLTFDFANPVAGTAALNLANTYDKASIFFNFGTDGNTAGDKTYLWDDVTFVTGGGGGGGSSSTDFEGGSYTFNDFGGAVAAVVANPDASGINTSTQVAQMQKFAGEVFAGSTLDLGGAVALAAGDSYTMKVRAQRSVVVTLKLEPLNVETTATHSGSGTWEELCFDFTGVSGNVTGLTVIFDNGTAGDAANDPNNWTFQYDDIAQTSNTCSAGGSQITLPVTFEDAGLDYELTDFGGVVTTMPFTDPADAGNTVASSNKAPGAELWGGTTVANATGFGAIPFTATDTTMTVRVYSPDAGIPVRLKVEDVTNAGISVETEALTTTANAWETLTFDFANEVAGTAALNLANTYDKASIFFNFGTDGNTAGDKTYLWDDVTFVTGGGGGGTGGGFVNGDFETGDFTGWTQFQDPPGTGSIAIDSSGQGGRAGNVARLMAAGSAVTGTNDVIIGQVALAAGTIMPGDTISVSFDLFGSLTGAGGVVFVEVIFLDGNGSDNGRDFVGPAAPYTPTATWTTHSGAVTAGTTVGGGSASVAGGVTLELKAACGAIAGGCGVDASFDNVTFTIN